jgi:phosphatidylinositol phospholipase C delta
LGDKYDNVKQRLAAVSPRESSRSLDPNDVDAMLERPRARSKSSKTSINMSEPIVMHGWTLTAPVGFRDVCKAIKESAFTEENDLPIIISLEVHACMEQQEVMVDIMKEEWAGLLLDKPFDTCKPAGRQPSLQELRRKILIKVKRPPEKVTLLPGNNITLMPPTALEEDPACASEDERCELNEKYCNGSELNEKYCNGSDLNEKKQKQPPIPAVPICESLGALAIYTHSERFRSNFKLPAAQTHSHIFSVAEKRILELHASEKKAELLAHNRRFFMRAYPNPSRVDSSNMDPSLFWRKGVQMVAMNWQCWDEDMVLNDAMFAPDTRGWVLKPPGFRSDDNDLAIQYRTLDLRITIYAGQHIPLPERRQKDDDVPSTIILTHTAEEKRFRPYVEVKLLVEKAEEKEKAAKAAKAGDEFTPKIPSEAKFLTPKQLPTPKLVQEERFSSPKLTSEERSSTPKLESARSTGTTASGKAAPKEVHYKQKTTVKETPHPDWGLDGYDLEFIDIPKVVEQLSFVR